jgi:hypothetical protein
VTFAAAAGALVAVVVVAMGAPTRLLGVAVGVVAAVVGLFACSCWAAAAPCRAAAAAAGGPSPAIFVTCETPLGLETLFAKSQRLVDDVFQKCPTSLLFGAPSRVGWRM